MTDAKSLKEAIEQYETQVHQQFNKEFKEHFDIFKLNFI